MLGVEAVGVEVVGSLSAATVKALTYPKGKERPVRFGDGDGLYLQIARGGSKSWLFRYTLGGKAREMGLGSFGESRDEVSLAKARILAMEARAKLRARIDPISERQTERQEAARNAADAVERTFRAAAVALVESKQPG
jgi:hypothetical protein